MSDPPTSSIYKCIPAKYIDVLGDSEDMFVGSEVGSSLSEITCRGQGKSNNCWGKGGLIIMKKRQSEIL